MGLESFVPIVTSLIAAHSASSVQSANAAAQSNLNKKTMKFNHDEAALSRDFSAKQAAIDRQFNASQQVQNQQFSAKQAQAAMKFNAAEAEKGRVFNKQESLLARQFEERMSSTAHQREVQDLRSAGLNPILSATGGNGASSPVAPILSSPVATGVAAQSSALGHSSGSVPAASVSGLKAPVKTSFLGEFINSAMDNMRLKNDYIRAMADDKNADANMKRAVTDDKRAVQEIEESISRVGLNYDQHELNAIRKRGEVAQAKLYEEKVLSEIQERMDKHNVSEAMQFNLHKTAEAAGVAAHAQAQIAALKEKIETAESPERIKNLRNQADMYKSIFDKNKWAIEDPKAAAQRKWWRENPEAAHANEFLDILGNVVHGSVGIHTFN